jgi:hypothetical protein
VEPRRDLFQVEKIARLFIEVLFDYRSQKKYLLHEFVVMPDHFHLILTPRGITLEGHAVGERRLLFSAEQEPES